MAELRSLVSARGLLGVAVPVMAITALHYGAPHHAHWVHDVARRLFYLPIVLGAAIGGLRGGVAVALLVWLVYFPHAFLPTFGPDPSSTSEKALEMGFYMVLGLLSGAIVDRLEAQDQQLARAARLEALGQLTAGLAHEIKNPLHAMRGTAEIVLDAVPPGTDEHGMGQALLAEIDRLDGVLKRFLAFARPGRMQVRPTRLDEAARSVATLVRAQASQQGVQVEVDGGSVVALADPELVVQVALGVALNALQAMDGHGGGRLRIQTLYEPPRLVLDNDGPPIPDADLDRIFDPFFSGRVGGTGLGLSTAWSLMEGMGGSVDAQNRPGGVVFTLTFRQPSGRQPFDPGA